MQGDDCSVEIDIHECNISADSGTPLLFGRYNLLASHVLIRCKRAQAKRPTSSCCNFVVTFIGQLTCLGILDSNCPAVVCPQDYTSATIHRKCYPVSVFAEDYWLAHPEAEVRIRASFHQGYGSQLPELEAAIRALHAQVSIDTHHTVTLTLQAQVRVTHAACTDHSPAVHAQTSTLSFVIRSSCCHCIAWSACMVSPLYTPYMLYS